LHGTFAFADQIGFVGLEAMEAETVFLRVDRDGTEAQFIGGAEDADGDFASIERKQFSHGWDSGVGTVGRVDFQFGIG
jgi:hypothetical protein